MSDRDGYQGALAQSRKWLADQAAATTVVERSVLTRRLQHELSRIDYAPHLLDNPATDADPDWVTLHPTTPPYPK